MLVGFEKKFIFIANLKTASTSIESLFGDFAEFKISQSAFGKHKGISAVEIFLEEFAGSSDLSGFFRFAVMRDPVRWLNSLYRSHKSVKFENTALSTLGMSFSEFLDVWCDINHDMARPQVERFKNRHGLIDIDYVIDFANLADGVRDVARSVNVEINELSPVDLDEKILRKIEKRYISDFEAREAFMKNSGRNPYRHIDSFLASAGSNIISDVGSELDQEKSLIIDVENHSAKDRRLTEDDVIWAFRYILGREPESYEAITSHLGLSSREVLRRALLESVEFRSSLSGIPSF
jgi:hypothetical protein